MWQITITESIAIMDDITVTLFYFPVRENQNQEVELDSACQSIPSEILHDLF